MTPGRIAFRAACALVGALVGGAALLALEGAAGVPDPDVTRAAPTPSPSPSAELRIVKRPERVAPRQTLLLAWAPGGLPPGAETAVEAARGVVDATTVQAGLDWMSSSRGLDGTVVDDPPRGMKIPIELAYVSPWEYASFVPPAERDLVRALGPGKALLAASEERLRGTGEGLRMRFADRSLRVAGVVSDVATQGYEVLVAGSPPRYWTQIDRYLLIHVKPNAPRSRVERALAPLLTPGQPLRVRAQGETPFLRYGDAVLPQMLIKRTFGEFAAQPLADGRLAIDPAWLEANLLRASVPLVGEITCHRTLFPQLRSALHSLVAEGGAQAVNPQQFGGCFGARTVNSVPGGRISHHAWGIAIDFNVAENLFGTRPDQDPRLVAVMEEAGFNWGGEWLIPDGMHFEWIRFP